MHVSVTSVEDVRYPDGVLSAYLSDECEHSGKLGSRNRRVKNNVVGAQPSHGSEGLLPRVPPFPSLLLSLRKPDVLSVVRVAYLDDLVCKGVEALPKTVGLYQQERLCVLGKTGCVNRRLYSVYGEVVHELDGSGNDAVRPNF